MKSDHLAVVRRSTLFSRPVLSNELTPRQKSRSRQEPEIGQSDIRGRARAVAVSLRAESAIRHAFDARDWRSLSAWPAGHLPLLFSFLTTTISTI